MSEQDQRTIDDLQALIGVARASVGVIDKGQMTGEALLTDLHAMRSILNRIERRISDEC